MVQGPSESFREEVGSSGALRYESTSNWIKVTHVCRCWRDVATSRASLWTNIFLRDSNKPQESQLNLFQLLLNHSKQAYLTIHLKSLEGIQEPVL